MHNHLEHATPSLQRLRSYQVLGEQPLVGLPSEHLTLGGWGVTRPGQAGIAAGMEPGAGLSYADQDTVNGGGAIRVCVHEETRSRRRVGGALYHPCLEEPKHGHDRMIGNVPPEVDDKTYIRAVKGALPWLHARQHLRDLREQDAEWTAYSIGRDPVNLGLIVVSEEFADWFKKRWPEQRHMVDEIRSMPEKQAFKEIRKGRWVESTTGFNLPDE